MAQSKKLFLDWIQSEADHPQLKATQGQKKISNIKGQLHLDVDKYEQELKIWVLITKKIATKAPTLSTEKSKCFYKIYIHRSLCY